ncbi:MAG: hypothetical protein IIX54_05260 [Clostridia bacterium]|nr:hypothetical protein [Clostridia bacterium]
MPLPLFLGIAAGIAAIGGVGSGISGAIKMKDANDTMKYSEERHNNNMKKFKSANTKTTKSMDELGKKEIEILSSFEKFSNLFEKIQNKPEFDDVVINGNVLPKYNGEELKKVYIGACALMGGLSGAALGTAGGFAAAGATTAAVMTLGTASTGTAIASLSGAAATNATLAALGGGATAFGGGGIALGTTMLGVTTAGVGLLVGGIIFNITGSSISNKADEAFNQMKKAEAQINEICLYLKELNQTASTYRELLCCVDSVYQNHLSEFENLVDIQKKIDWLDYSEEEKSLVQNTVLLVGLLYKMCKVQLVLKSEKDTEPNKINHADINSIKDTAGNVLDNFNVKSPEEVADLEEELFNIATVATVMYFAKCDGSVSKEEKDILVKTINAICNNKTLSDNAKSEIKALAAKEAFDFNEYKTYLDPISPEKLYDLKRLIIDVVNASDGVALQEMSAIQKFSSYLDTRDE